MITFQRFVLLIGFLFVAIGLITSSVFAQVSGDASVNTVGESESPDSETPELVYAVSRYAQTLANAPASVTLIGREEIQSFGWRNLGEILESVAGFFTSDDRTYSYVTVRGLTTMGDYGSRILVMVNGHRINRAVWEYAGWGSDRLIDMSSIERVEVIRGAGSSMYGTNGLYAVINIVTRQGSDVQGVEAEVAGGSYSSWDGALMAGGKTTSSGLDYFVNLSGYQTDGSNLYFPEWDDAATNNGWSIGLDDEELINGYGRIKFGDFSVEAAFFDNSRTIPTASFGVDFNDPRTVTSDDQFVGSVAYEKAFMNLSRVSASLTYNASEYAGDWPYENVMFRETTTDEVWTLEGQYQFFLGAHSLTIGGEARSVGSTFRSFDLDPAWDYLNEEHDDSNEALYAQGDFRFGERVVVVAGLRYDNYDGFGGTTNPRLAFVYKLGGNSSLKAMYNEAFRAPSPVERYYSDGYSWKKPESELAPETLKSFELALEHAFSPRLRGSATVFHVEVDGLIGLIEDPEDGLLVYSNLGQLETDGLEIEFGGRVAGPLNARLSYTYQDATDPTTGERLVNSPKNMAWLGLSADFLDRLGSAAMDLRYVGSRQRLDGGDESSYVVVGTMLQYRPFRDERLELFADINNLFDADYGHVVGDEHVQQVLQMNGRTFRIGLRAHLGLNR